MLRYSSKKKNSIIQVIIVSGETGCGKRTQIPQFILESEMESVHGAVCSIICTQPRRISAMSVSERVASERGEKLGESVSLPFRCNFLGILAVVSPFPSYPFM